MPHTLTPVSETMRRHQLIPINVRFFGASLRRLSLHIVGEGGEGGEAGAGGGAGAGGDAPKTYTEADIAALKAKNAELIGKNKTLTARAAVIGDRTPEEVQADLEFAAKAKEDKAKAEGNFTALQQQMAEKHAKELATKDGRTKKVEGKLFDVLGKREVELALKAAGGNEKVMLPHILPFIKVVEIDDEFVAQVVDAKGNPRIADGQATPMTIAQLVDQFKADETFSDNFKASGASGSGARNDAGGRSAGAVVLIPKDATPQEYRRLKADAEKRGVGYAIAS